MKFTLCKKQYIYLALAIISIALAITTRAFAEETPAAGEDSVLPIEKKLPGYSEVPKEEPTEKAEGKKAALEERMQDRIINLARNVEGKMNAAVERMDNIIKRLDARILILKDAGVDTTKAEEALTISKNSLALAQSMLTSLDASIVSSVTSDNPRVTFKNLKSQFVVIREALRDVHTYLLSTVTALKEAVKAKEEGRSVSDAVKNTPGTITIPPPVLPTE